MSVTFGTPVEVDITDTTTKAAVMSGVTLGQPIVLVCYAAADTGVPSGIVDTFSTPYTWTVIDSSTASSRGIATYIGTGGSGASGTITVTFPSSSYPGIVAIPCIGASLASGLFAIDVHGVTNGTGTTIGSVSLTPGASGEGAIYAGGTGGGADVSGGPGSPWSNTFMVYVGLNRGEVSTYESPTSGVALTTSWTQGSSVAYWAVGVIVKAAAASAKSALMAVTM